ncbi:amino acid transporter [Gonapodya prolifera JEL478]|uniref:Amino acid transporter n=1 Tax=Gonapodya prolifera (strain JEL478) TaxID=1344416 RepID=A0A139AJQ5_GONPJ|nr:amino acid transporter [Gonapodya prolifera JEL478]|eukprot:KXS16989.1 amino acid transporter [Gonapodya prolifera JEL478]
MGWRILQDRGTSGQLETMITISEDELRLARMGYQQEFRRSFKWIHNFGFSLSHLCLLAYAPFFAMGLKLGGPSATLFAWIVVCFFNLCVSFSLAEICSAWPCSGGLYYWSAKLGGLRYGALLSWFTAYFNLFGEIGALSSAGYGLSMTVFSCIEFYKPDFVPTQWQTTFLAIGFVLVWAVLNSFSDSFLARLMELSLAVQILGPIAIMIILLAVSPTKQSAGFVFNTFENLTGQDSMAYAIVLSLIIPSWSFIGYDSSAHISEETVNAYKDVPKSLIYSVALTAVLGLPFILNATQSEPCSIILSSIVFAGIFFNGLAVNTACSRMMFAFARDDGFGKSLSARLRWMHPQNRTPQRAVWGGCFLAVVVLAVGFATPIGGELGVLSIGAVGLMTAYMIPIFCKVAFMSDDFEPGEFTLGYLSAPMGWIAVVYVLFLLVLLCLPYDFPVTMDNFNFASLMAVGVLLLASLFWLLSARHWYVGPVRRVDDVNIVTMERNIVAAKDTLSEIGILSPTPSNFGSVSSRYSRMESM